MNISRYEYEYVQMNSNKEKQKKTGKKYNLELKNCCRLFTKHREGRDEVSFRLIISLGIFAKQVYT